jgi:hypothetical protein
LERKNCVCHRDLEGLKEKGYKHRAGVLTLGRTAITLHPENALARFLGAENDVAQIIISFTLKNKPLKGFNGFKLNVIEISRRVSTARSIKVV